MEVDADRVADPSSKSGFWHSGEIPDGFDAELFERGMGCFADPPQGSHGKWMQEGLLPTGVDGEDPIWFGSLRGEFRKKHRRRCPNRSRQIQHVSDLRADRLGDRSAGGMVTPQPAYIQERFVE